MGHMVPVAANNAIESIVFALEFESGMEAPLFQAIGTSAGLAALLGPSTAEQGFSVIFSAGQMPPSVENSTIERYRFERPGTQPGRPKLSLWISKQSIACVFNQYTRWADISGEAYAVLEAVIEAAGTFPASLLRPSAIALRVKDRFVWNPPFKPEDLRSCLKPSRYVSEHLFEVDNLWHSHHGYFVEAPAEGWWLRRLDVINVDAVDIANHERAITINMTHRLQARPGLTAPTAIKDVRAEFEALHAVHRNIFSELLTDDMLDSVGVVPA